MRTVLPRVGLYQSRCLRSGRESSRADIWPVLFMTVRDEIAQSRCETGTRSPERPKHT